MADVQLHSLDLSSPLVVPRLATLLSPFMPYTVPLLGNIFQSQRNDSKAQIWTTLTAPPSSQFQPPTLFSVIVLPEPNEQLRIFCSAEFSPDPPTSDEEAHVVGVVQSFLLVAARMPTRDMHVVALFGSVHDKWTTCLKPHCQRIGHFKKFLRRPGRHNSIAPAPPDALFLSQIQESDIDIVRATSRVARSREYILSRCPTSVCARVGEDGGKPVAWVLMHSDGSIGTLHVEPHSRRKGVGRWVMDELLKRSGSTSFEDNAGGGGALGWNWTDVGHENRMAIRFFESLDGWEEGWLCNWMAFAVA